MQDQVIEVTLLKNWNCYKALGFTKIQRAVFAAWEEFFDGFQVCNIIAVFKNYVLYMAVNNIVPSLKKILVVHHFQTVISQ